MNITAETTQISSLWDSITWGDVLVSGVTIVVGFGVAVFVYWTFNRHQKVASESQRQIASHTIRRLLEQDIAGILSARSVQYQSQLTEGFQEGEFRFLLDNAPAWSFEPDTSAEKVAGQPQVTKRESKGQRYCLVRRSRRSEEYLASSSLQETLLWFRRVSKAWNDKVVYSGDLADMWRFIIPFGYAGRLSYFSHYFQGEDEIQAMVRVINETLRACCDKNWTTPLRYFKAYRTQEDLDILTRDEDSRAIHGRIDGPVPRAKSTEP